MIVILFHFKFALQRISKTKWGLQKASPEIVPAQEVIKKMGK